MVEAYVMVLTAAGTTRDLLSEIQEIDGVRRANIVAGEYDIVADVDAEDAQHLLRLVTDEIQSLEGVGRTRTCIILE